MKLTSLKLVFLFELIVVLLVIFGCVEREASLALLGILIFYILFSPLKDGLILFVASVPIFVALPITESFDSLSSARVIILVLFLKWFFINRKTIWDNLKSLTFKKIFKNYRLEFFVVLLFIVMALSVIYAVDIVSAVKKIIYLANLALIFILVKDYLKNNNSLKRLIKAILISFGLILLIALGQLISVYFFTIGGFWDWWADHFSVGFYGENLRQIVKNMNAWFAYSPAGPSIIRLFGSFTDPHSFALYLVLCLPFLTAFAFSSIKEKVSRKAYLLFLTLLFIVLSGTRGVWISVAFAVLAGIYLLIKRIGLTRVVSVIISCLVIFIALIPISSVLTVIPQFKDQEGDIDTALFLKRLTSILDLDEESNQGRIYIWKQSLKTLKQAPWLGVGVGNFPIVLYQNVVLAKAGSSAHNLYLNFAVESGIFAFILIVLIFLEILFALLTILKSKLPAKMQLLITGIFIYLIWVFAYSFFDIALLDERVFLLFLTILGIIYGIKARINKYSDL